MPTFFYLSIASYNVQTDAPNFSQPFQASLFCNVVGSLSGRIEPVAGSLYILFYSSSEPRQPSCRCVGMLPVAEASRRRRRRRRRRRLSGLGALQDSEGKGRSRRAGWQRKASAGAGPLFSHHHHNRSVSAGSAWTNAGFLLVSCDPYSPRLSTPLVTFSSRKELP
jgi:hypothetical protein